ncbi:EpsG family protein [Chitinophaga niabensis]|uniref:EpsG family protein n=1 Tax=Chitinophaga niabensis TaxID=536979 RepID=UPI0009413665|nr:EpsG family protein [Chitinophaga niabensis]
MIILVFCVISSDTSKSNRVLIFSGIFVGLLLIAGLRHNVGTDYPTYKLFYDNPDQRDIQFEYIYTPVRNLLTFFGLPSPAFFLLCSFITFFYFFKGFKAYSVSIPLSILLFITLGFYTNSFNIVRQFVALGLYFYFGLRYMKSRQFFHYLLTILIISVFHISALLMLPFYFIVNLNIRAWQMLIVLLAAVLINIGILSISLFTTPISAVLPPHYAGYLQFLEHYLSTLEEPLLVKFLNNVDKITILFLLLKYKPKLLAADASNKILINFYFIHVVFLFISRGLAELQRIGFYFSIFSLLAIPLLLLIPENKYGKAMMATGITLLYTAYFFFFVLGKNVGEVIPYKTIFQ